MGKEVNKKVSQLEIQIAEKFKNCSTYLAIREVKAKTTLRFYLSPTRMPKTKQNKTNVDKCWHRCKRKECLFIAGGRKNWVCHYRN